ncbi:MAG: chorismate synthase [Spirochaetae bacterium HGW-Spirochaetae-7]|jgi:chorismate synthase|nr:MAG: chorismate synthase [Spirochaetae bacterium HGW-Spirochaetae-7]
MNAIGTLLRVEILGESHGPAIGVVIDGVPAGMPLSEADFEPDLARRRSGADGTTPRVEADVPEFLSGLYDGRTTGSPLCIVFRNEDKRSGDYAPFSAMPRPGHADYTARIRYDGFADPRGSGHFSGRVTAGLVAAGVVAKRLLTGATFSTTILEAGGKADVAAAAREAADSGDSVGAIVELRVKGAGAGLGEPFFGSVEGLVAQALFAVPGVRGVEFGDGFAAAAMRGSEHNDPIVAGDGATAKNGSGGVNGGITNGNELQVRVAMKPASSIRKVQNTWNFETGAIGELSSPGRHDACIALRAAVVLEAALAVVLADLELQARSRGAGSGTAGAKARTIGMKRKPS